MTVSYTHLTLGYTHYQPAQLVTVGKRATLWMQDLLSDLEELDFVLDHMKFLGCRGTTGTEASFMDLFDGDGAKIDEMNRQIAAEFGFEQCYACLLYTSKALGPSGGHSGVEEPDAGAGLRRQDLHHG